MESKLFPHKHLLSAEQLSADDIHSIFTRTEFFLEFLRSGEKKRNDLSGISVLLAFFENSTRTRVSFEIAAKRLGAEITSFQASASSVSKGESLLDTVWTLEAMHTDILIMRHNHSGAHEFLAPRIKSAIINAGDGQHQHPTQGLLDVFTLKKHFGSIAGKKICLVGDILHSRVIRSNISLLKTLGAEVGVCAPGTLLPRGIEIFGVKQFARTSEAVNWADALNILRIQQERMDSGLLPTLTEFSTYYGISEKYFKNKPELVILHPGPMNRGVEIDSEVADAPQSLILRQVEHGVAVRMAILAILAENLKKNF